MTKIELLTLTDDALDSTVKIQGTKYDRKRTVSDANLKKAKALFSKGKTISEIANKLGMNYSTVRYNVDEAYRKEFNMKRSGAHTGKDHITKLDRVAYKRKLVAAGKISA